MEIVSQIGKSFLEKGATLATAESCTGGLVGHLLTNVAGSSEWYMGGVVCYSNQLKHGILGVRKETLNQVGAVSPEVARQMALGARQAFDTDYAISITGIAGPGGGTAEKPVGLVYVGVATPETVVVRRYLWNGSRSANKQSSAEAALQLLLELFQHGPPTNPEGLEAVTVEATFTPDGAIRPLSFIWEGRSLRISDWGRQWEKGGTRYFLVMTPDNRVWELRFVPAQLGWLARPRSEARQMV